MIMSEFSTNEKNVTKFLADYYPINGYSYRYMNNPLEINKVDLLRVYLVNMGIILAHQCIYTVQFLMYIPQDYFLVNRTKLKQ
jgi:hypothetical protein